MELATIGDNIILSGSWLAIAVLYYCSSERAQIVDLMDEDGRLSDFVGRVHG